MTTMRIARALALAGVDARRKCESHVLEGEVCVNGEKIRDLGHQVDPTKDRITLRGKLLTFERHVYYILNKPKGYTTTTSDPYATKTIYELLPHKLARRATQNNPSRKRVFPVGRLDRESKGLLLLTSDGDLAYKLLHPRFEISKWYRVKLHKPLQPEAGKKLLVGVRLKEGWAKVQKLHGMGHRNVSVELKEGKKREVRRIFDKLGYRVQDLTRTSFASLKLNDLKVGQGRFLNDTEVETLRESIGRLGSGLALSHFRNEIREM